MNGLKLEMCVIWLVAVFLCQTAGFSYARGPPKIIGEQHKHVQAKLGKNFKMPCNVDFGSTEFMVWSKDHEKISNGWTRFKIVNEGTMIRIKNVELGDAGVYVCKATNGFGSVEVNYTLSVLDEATGLINNRDPNMFYHTGAERGPNGEVLKPKKSNGPEFIAPHPVNTTVKFGEKASFQCRVKSAVQPTIKWLKKVEDHSNLVNQTTIDFNGGKYMVLETTDVWTDQNGFHLNKLTINRATEADSGMYVCFGASTIGYNFKSAYLTVVKDHIYHRKTNNGHHTEIDGKTYNRGTYPGSSEESQSQETATEASDSTIPLIAVPICVLVILIVVVIFFRRHHCCASQDTVQRQRFQVPTQDPYPPIPTQHILQMSREKNINKNHNIDFYSDISSVSRQHYHQPPSHYS